MATPARKTAAPAATADVQQPAAAPADAAVEQLPAGEGPSPIEGLFDRARLGLLEIITDAVSKETGHGVDIVTARQAAEVYQILFGEMR